MKILLKTTLLFALFLMCQTPTYTQNPKRFRDFGIKIGVLPTGKYNAITDVVGVKVGHQTLIKADSIRTGVTAILPYDGNIFQQKVPAAIYIGNGFGKLTGISQVRELGNIEAPIILTNTLNVATGINAVVSHTLAQKGNENPHSIRGSPDHHQRSVNRNEIHDLR